MPPEKFVLKTIKVLPNQQQLCALRFSRCGKILAGGTFQGTIARWACSNDVFSELAPITGHHGWVQSLAFHADGERLFAADSWGQLSSWNYAHERPQAAWSVDAHDGWIHQLALSPDGAVIATVGRDQTIRLTNAANGRVIRTLPAQEEVLSIAFHPHGKYVVSGDLRGSIKIWDVASGSAARTLDASAMYLKDRIQDVGGVRCFAFDNDGALLLAGGSRPKTGGFVTGVQLLLAFDWHTGKILHTLQGSADTEGYIFDMVWHPSGYVMAVTSGQPGTGKLYFQRLTEAQPFLVQAGLANCHSLTMHPDCRRLAVSGTNANSAGNGRPKGDKYPGNFSPVHIFALPKNS